VLHVVQCKDGENFLVGCVVCCNNFRGRTKLKVILSRERSQCQWPVNSRILTCSSTLVSKKSLGGCDEYADAPIAYPPSHESYSMLLLYFPKLMIGSRHVQHRTSTSWHQAKHVVHADVRKCRPGAPLQCLSCDSWVRYSSNTVSASPNGGWLQHKSIYV
jgi:hypothetical protein